ncbi:hypothetical protein BJX63DRAFT_433400 [Aspergillus granulosus]|uniref:Uncharacterized protein n=1 Tax=Aspergillus granulosus TaxID=176169 RepID=A0ABR4H7G2_9EURO
MRPVILDTRSTNRIMFMAGMRYIPPLTDLVSSTASASIRNNGQRRFFQPWLLDRVGDRGEYFGQQLNLNGDGSPGSFNDPEWNAQADPLWSWNGTKIAYYQTLTVPPQCGGVNPLSCPVPTTDGRRTYRIMLATLTGHKPIKMRYVKPVPDVIPWGVPIYPRGGYARPVVSTSGCVHGKASGHAEATLVENRGGNGLETVAVEYYDYSDQRGVMLNGGENVTAVSESLTLERVTWFSNLTSTGNHAKVTGDRYFIFSSI